MGRPSPLESVLDPVIPELAELVRQNPGTLSLAQGMVGWDPPVAVAAAVRAALAIPGPALHRYGAAAGEPFLLERIEATLRQEHQLDLAGSSLWVTAGSNMAFAAIAKVLAGPDRFAAAAAEPRELILPLPYYFNHVMAVQLAGGIPVPVDAGLIPDPAVLEAAITPRTCAIVTVSPNNPSGVVFPPAVLAEINRLCASRGLFHISDEAYGAFVHGEVPHWSPGSAVGAAAHTISLYSLSKTYGMAGWRLGFMAVPKQLDPAMAKVQDTLLICPPLISQRAAAAALEAGPAWCAPRLAALAQRRRQLLAALAEQQALGLPVQLVGNPDGAFYGLLQIGVPGGLGRAGVPMDSLTVMRRLVREHRVAAVAGSSFGLEASIHGCLLRLSYGLLEETQLAEALTRLFAGIRAISAP